ncbi:cofilin-2 [Heterostelium album PN500]|uniref:Cofilin-2 n=1 Tax=Heterostelium pallidum (strain ATCC 26659 / Pp 5 / PN500) TaxID=670386 RepID=D3B726_HETP5|nr:cofilin-2 [Heterostelium album PN500]EFA82569.1 cofilin-2 [Heterostelium album PN500]|eukprot:XP_020434686.1 cofilin-2 [Heterostelium album PN500]
MSVVINPECKAAVDVLKQKVNRAVIFRADAATRELVVDRTFPEGTQYDDVISNLVDDHGRFLVVDFQYTNKENVATSKPIFIFWYPHAISAEEIELYSNARAPFSQDVGIPMLIQAVDQNEITPSCITYYLNQ